MTAPTPLSYEAWRRSLLGRTTEAVERAAVMELCGGVAGARILDVGCGDGAYALALARRGARATGVDLSPAALARAGANARAAGAAVALAAG
ncbi:class I SAM-dependent methyltransferase, partial [Anaeromyxobacter sp. SG26]